MYRLQFNRDFGFADAERLVPYLAALGVSHLYASPWLKARAGSAHGYDIVDHNAFNPEVGSEEDFNRLDEALRANGLGHILDFVPNHMGIAQADNAWWLDVLEWGRASPYADYFDIDWAPTEPRLRNKVLLPFLGGHYGEVLEAGELVPRFDAQTGTFSVWYFGHRFPIAPRDYGALIHAGLDAGAPPELAGLAARFTRLQSASDASARRRAAVREEAGELKRQLADLAADPALRARLEAGAAALAGTPGDPASFRPLHALLERQAYRLAYWRVAADEINYRRFFDINDLAGIRIENPRLFAEAHRLVSTLLADGRLDGLRLDHIDGLFDPAEYCRRLAGIAARPFYVVVEKILAHHEHLRPWPIAGTTGYDFLNQVNALLIDPDGERALTRTYRRVLGREADFDEMAYTAKKDTIQTKLSSELNVLARDLNRISERHWRTRDYTLESLTDALTEVVAAFPVYRTYVDAHGASADDRRDIAWAVAQARRRWQAPDADIFDFIEAALTADLARERGYRRGEIIRFAMKFQQYTGPVMAKGFEDTALYRYHRLTALNEVGGEPRQFGLSIAAFHHANRERAEHWPHAMLTTATHDTKRGEDVRARLAVLAAMPDAWDRHVRQWRRLNRRQRRRLESGRVPDRNDEYLLYQTLVGAWPVKLLNGWDSAVAEAFTGRLQAYMNKAVREAKTRSSWTNPDTDYEQGVSDFVARLLDPVRGRLFLDDFLPLAREVATHGIANSLIQLVLKLTCPGVPDIYQGGELWDFNLVDPDNRRRVDFALRARLLNEVAEIDRLDGERRINAIETVRADWYDGRIKLFVLYRLLQLRSHYPGLFADGGYQPIDARGARADDVCAFARTHEGRTLIVVVLRQTARGRDRFDATILDTQEEVVTIDWLMRTQRVLGAQTPVAAVCGEWPFAVLVTPA
ncbi:MAG TPA: malto-oligosyltrehalose synthase [Gammaproteobacteria bacterium]|nr:malto-oligosyltrehalose synthase [Gammaproteobacteria bacterium]